MSDERRHRMKFRLFLAIMLLLAVSMGQSYAHEEQQKQIDELREQIRIILFEEHIRFHHKHTPELCITRESLEHHITEYKRLYFDRDRRVLLELELAKSEAEAFELAESRSKSMVADLRRHAKICEED